MVPAEPRGRPVTHEAALWIQSLLYGVPRRRITSMTGRRRCRWG